MLTHPISDDFTLFLREKELYVCTVSKIILLQSAKINNFGLCYDTLFDLSVISARG